MRLLVLIPNLGDGGAQSQCVRLVNELGRRRDVDVVLVRHPGGVHEAHLDTAAITDRSLPTDLSHRDPRAVLAVRRIVQETRPDVVLTWLPMGDIVGGLAIAGLGVPWVIVERDSGHAPGWRTSLRRRLGRRADLVLAISRSGADWWRNGGRPAHRPTLVVDNIVVPAPTVPWAPRDTVAFIGRLAPQKNIHVVARAMALSADEHPRLHHVMAGHGPLADEVRALVDGHAVELAGYVDDVHPMLARSAALVLVSHHEGLPNVVLEAVTHDVPIVASDLPEHRELLGRDYPWFVADRDSPEAVARVIDRVVGEPDPHALDHARARVREMTAEKVADAYLAHLAALAPQTR